MKLEYISDLVAILERLRAEGGCPWDREQTHQTLKRFLIEESGELLDAIDDGDDRGMCDELGDVLLQVVFHSQIAREEGRFDLADVARGECEKMIRRHPHVFGDASAANAAAVVDQWEEIKRAERGVLPAPPVSAMAGVPRSLPALHRAQKILRKAGKVGFEWADIDAAMAKVKEELAEVAVALASDDQSAIEEELGDLLLAVVNVCRWRHLEAEDVMQQAIRKFDRRFRALEDGLTDADRALADCDTDELISRWQDTGGSARRDA